MENSSNILWVLIVGASIIASVVTKKREEQRKKASSPPQDTIAQEEAPRKPAQHSMEMPHPTETPFSKPKNHSEQREIAPAIRPNAIEDKSTLITTDSTTNTEPQESIMEDFSLQKAVIWSEILKPKFDEESN